MAARNSLRLAAVESPEDREETRKESSGCTRWAKNSTGFAASRSKKPSGAQLRARVPDRSIVEGCARSAEATRSTLYAFDPNTMGTARWRHVTLETAIRNGPCNSSRQRRGSPADGLCLALTES